MLEKGLSRGLSADSPRSVLLDIQGLRAIAVLLVVAYHAGLPLPGGFVGVDMFFVISGFVITLVLQREWTRTGDMNLVRFYARRFKRLIPALALVLAVTVLLSPLLLSPLGPQETTGWTALGAILLGANFVIARTSGSYFDDPAEGNALLHTWSLSVEEQFYLVFPLLLLLAWRFARGRRLIPIAGVLAVAVGSLTLALAGAWGLPSLLPESLVGFYGPGTRAWEFAIGALIAMVGLRSKRRVVTSRLLSLLGMGTIIVSVLFVSEHTPFPGPWTLLPVAGTALLIASAHSDPIASRLLLARPLMWIGDRSYSIYLWHWPILVFTAASFPSSSLAPLVAALLSVVPAAASFRWLEEPLRRAALPPTRIVIRLAAATTASVALLSGALVVASKTAYGSEQLADLRSAARDVTEGCHDYVPLGSERSERCSWNGDATGVPVLLLGDSHAKHLSAGFIRAGELVDRPVIVATASGCPMLDVYVAFPGSHPSFTRDCRSYFEGSLEYLLESEPTTVVLSASDLYWRDETTAVGMDATDLSAERDRKLEIGRQAWTRTVDELRKAGHEVLLVQDVPRWSDEYYWNPLECTGLELITSGAQCVRTMPLDFAQERQGEVWRSLSDVAEARGVELLDPIPLLCPNGACSTWNDDIMTYRDSNHISVAQSKALGDWFAVALSSDNEAASDSRG